MKKIIIAITFLLSISFITLSQSEQEHACYVCSDNSYVKFYNPDSKEKRKKAKDVFQCDIVGRVPSCKEFIGVIK